MVKTIIFMSLYYHKLLLVENWDLLLSSQKQRNPHIVALYIVVYDY